MKKTAIILFSEAVLAVCFAACRNDEPTEPERHQPAEGVEEETYAGGVLGTTFNRSASAYEDPTPAVEQAGMVNAFKYGEFFFEHTITQNNPPFNGLGPLYVRSSCESCHPGIIIGAVWANISWGTYWSWDPKETWALITLLIYALPLIDGGHAIKSDRAFNTYCMLAFLSVAITYFGVNLLLGGMHSYS